jgi:hypothetical protein
LSRKTAITIAAFIVGGRAVNGWRNHNAKVVVIKKKHHHYD